MPKDFFFWQIKMCKSLRLNTTDKVDIVRLDIFRNYPNTNSESSFYKCKFTNDICHSIYRQKIPAVRAVDLVERPKNSVRAVVSLLILLS